MNRTLLMLTEDDDAWVDHFFDNAQEWVSVLVDELALLRTQAVALAAVVRATHQVIEDGLIASRLDASFPDAEDVR